MELNTSVVELFPLCGVLYFINILLNKSGNIICIWDVMDQQVLAFHQDLVRAQSVRPFSITGFNHSQNFELRRQKSKLYCLNRCLHRLKSALVNLLDLDHICSASAVGSWYWLFIQQIRAPDKVHKMNFNRHFLY